MDWTFENYNYLFLLLLVPLMWLLIVNFIRWRDKRRQLFADNGFHSVLFAPKSNYRYVFIFLYILGFTFLILAFADLLGGREEMKVKHKISNVVLLMDVSNSMNAEDVDPSRLALEKKIVLETLHKMKDERVGIIVFAGNAVSIMPLTTDYSAVESYINALETSMIGQQGTDFLVAMKEAVKMYKNTGKTGRNVVLISDGEDNEGHNKEAASLAKSQGIRITAIGIGTEQGAPVPDYMYGQLMGYKNTLYGEPVISKRQTQALVQMSNGTGGTYIDGNNENAAIQLTNALGNLKSDTEVTTNSQSSIHYYQWFLGISFVLFFIIYLTNPKRDFNI
ncbi:VWA domain-containing protein [Elizabethkingia meningoseptica]|uniref:VWA domain-containing protein n=1 Tax=Elizabethkingia meningoseptica TaxID=238 RepID=UPI002DD66CE2|nr:VWA domain-containing protein [Elizabethkingia meningoseptica]MEC4713407.1 VWA domain-containing protein [Elizabethkingia meningoseptica]